VAVIRAFATFLGHALEPEQVSALAYEVEKLYHGTPSGIDNTVIAYQMPVYFLKGSPNRVERLAVGAPFTLLIADTGNPSPTAIAVGEVRRGWQADPERFEALFDQMGEIARQARKAIEEGDLPALGPLMNANHRILSEMGVSSPELDRLVAAARKAGAQGAKLSGGGQGGNMIALVHPQDAGQVFAALQQAGAARVIETRIEVAE
jgi:mevalonate kinase